ncbi:MAG: phage tail tape measure C-terminal domain-containing protein, partial [Candidatus Fonsibacter ubiquis]
QLAQQSAALRNATAQAQAEARKGSFAAGVSARESQFTGFISNLDAQKKATREALEDEYRYQDLLSQRINPETAKRRIELERIVSTEKDNLATQRDIIQEQIKGGTYSAEEVAILQQQVDKINARIAVQSELLAGVEAITEATKRLQKAREDAEGRDIGKGLKDGVKGYLDSIGTLAEGIKGVTGDALKGLEDQLVTFVSTGKANFSDLARSILADMTRIIVQQTIMKPIMSGLGGLFKFADGGIMGPDGPLPLRKYASGGIANSPQLALYGEGSMPEAFVPLPDGRRIPVAMKGAPGGGNATTVNVNVDASGTNVQGNGGQGQALGRAVAAAVQQELVRQKRPGGLLAV